MPNWVYNGVSVTDLTGEHAADVARLIEQVGADYSMVVTAYVDGEHSTNVEETKDPIFSFWNIVKPTGEDLDLYNKSIETGVGVTPFWYDWHCDNWGCKWDAGDVEFDDYGADQKLFRFSTPWAPPIPALTSLSKQYPNLHIELEWEEEQGFGGTFTFTNGEPTETDYYDIPSSHADYVSRDRECGCESWDEAQFEDCPTYVPEPTEDMIIADNELEVEAVR
jgi:hypothetical protein